MSNPERCVRIESRIVRNNLLPIVTVECFDFEFRGLVDTGASVSLISADIVRENNILSRVKPDSCPFKVMGITNDCVNIREKIEVKVEIAGRQFPVSLHIYEGQLNGYDAVLGLDFLINNRLSMDCELRCLRQGSWAASWDGNQSNDPKINSLTTKTVIGFTKRKCKLLPNSEHLIEVCDRDKSRFGDFVLIQPSGTSFRSSWAVSSSVNKYSKDGSYFVKVANFTDGPICINKGTKLVTLENIEQVRVDKARVNLVQKTDLDDDFDLWGGDLDVSHLDGDQACQMKALLRKHSDIFAHSIKDLSGCDTVAHRIFLTDNTPIRQKPYRTPHNLRSELKDQINQLLDAGIISESDSPYAAPIILVKKKTGSYRLVCDYRKLNLKTQPLHFPLPLISDLLDTLHGARFYSSLDLSSGYWQMNLDLRDRHKTAFCTQEGQYEWNRLPQGLRNAASSFQRLLERVLVGLKDLQICTYIDDIVVASSTFEEHIERLDVVFSRLSQHNLKVNPKKCQLAKNKINYLGFQVTDGKILPDGRNIETIERFPTPKNIKGVRSFLGLCNFYRKFIPHFADIAMPLTRLTKSGIKFLWSESTERAFEDLKKCLITYPCLRLPNVKAPFILNTDASGCALGAVLSQADENGDVHPIAYASRRLNDAETRYSTFERETLGVVWGITNFRHYLYGRKFTLFCDQKSLSFTLRLRDSGRVTRWALTLQEYDYDIRHVPGRENVVADVLSRAVNVTQTINRHLELSCLSPSRIRLLQQNDLKCVELLRELNSRNEVIRGNLIFYKRDGMLYCINRHSAKSHNMDKLVIPRVLIQEILSLAHDSPTTAHAGFKRTLYRIKEKFFWWGMNSHILNYVKSCIPCCEKKGYNEKHKAPLQRIEITSRPFERIGMDAIGPLPITEQGNRHIIVISDYFTRWVEAYPVPDLKTENIILVLEKFICQHGIPEHLITDRGKSFLAEGIEAVYRKLGIHKQATTSYHPSTDGVVERVNATLINSLFHMVNESGSNWDKYLHFAVLAHRTAFHSSIQDIPAHLVYGRDLVLPMNLISENPRRTYADRLDFVEDLTNRLSSSFRIVKQSLIEAAERQEKYRTRVAKDKNLRIGELVMLYTPCSKVGQSKKFTKFNKGTYRIIEQTSPVNFRIIHINNPKDIQHVHVDRLTRIPDRMVFPTVETVVDNNSSTGAPSQTHTPDFSVDSGVSEMPTYFSRPYYVELIPSGNDGSSVPSGNIPDILEVQDSVNIPGVGVPSNLEIQGDTSAQSGERRTHNYNLRERENGFVKKR